jgi:hypothetical protein
MAYRFAVPNGNYQIRLHFAETYSGTFGVGRRVFGVTVEGILAIGNLDIFAAVGANAALVRTLNASVTDGRLDIEFVHRVENPTINGIELIGLGATQDVSPPSAPGTLRVASVTSSRINLDWGPSTDDVGVVAYDVERCTGGGCTAFSAIDSVATLAYESIGLTPSTSYRYRIRARDAQGNPGNYSNIVDAGTSAPPGPDTEPPSAPGTLVLTVTSTGEFPAPYTISWGSASDNVGVTGYEVESCYHAGRSMQNECLSFGGFRTEFNPPVTVSSLSLSRVISNGAVFSHRVRAIDGAGNLGPYSNIVTVWAPGWVRRINVGGPAYTDSSGRLWAADTNFNTGNVATTPSSVVINGTSDVTLYRSARWDSASAPELTYRIPVSGGSYPFWTVILHFSETYSGAFGGGLRVFDVSMEGQLAFDNVDIYGAVGPNRTYTLSKSVFITDGILEITFSHGVENPTLNAIEVIKEVSPSGTY